MFYDTNKLLNKIFYVLNIKKRIRTNDSFLFDTKNSLLNIELLKTSFDLNDDEIKKLILFKQLVFALSSTIRFTSDDFTNTVFLTPKDVFYYYKNKISFFLQEHFFLIILNSNYELIKEIELYKGSKNTIPFHPLDFINAISGSVFDFIILMHNHPSNIVYPSKEDLHITKKIKRLTTLLNLNLLDHVIITKNKYFSFRENNLI